RFSKSGTVSMWIVGLPISSQGSSFNEAGTELIEALRDYAQTWVEELKNYPNHKEKWGIANLVLLSTDDELRTFLFGDD
ncbi:MAG: prevent-host-death protein, partial [Actinobacteria bacterium]|nr:prevent-host-death protein [Actinomycetota bacterium]